MVNALLRVVERQLILRHSGMLLALVDWQLVCGHLSMSLLLIAIILDDFNLLWAIIVPPRMAVIVLNWLCIVILIYITGCAGTQFFVTFVFIIIVLWHHNQLCLTLLTLEVQLFVRWLSQIAHFLALQALIIRIQIMVA